MPISHFSDVAGAPFLINLFVPSVGASAVNTTRQASVVLPFKVKVLKVMHACTAKAGTTNPTVDVWAGGSSILSAAQALSLANYDAQVDPSVTSIAAGTSITVRCTTAADGSITNLGVGVLVTKDE